MIFLGLGSNLPSIFGDRFKNIDLAMTFLEANRVKIVKKSSFYETPSYPDKSKPIRPNPDFSKSWTWTLDMDLDPGPGPGKNVLERRQEGLPNTRAVKDSYNQPGVCRDRSGLIINK